MRGKIMDDSLLTSCGDRGKNIPGAEYEYGVIQHPKNFITAAAI